MDDLRRHIFVIQNKLHRRALSHEHHQKGNVAAGIGQQQRGGGGAAGGPAHGEAGGNGLPGSDVRPLLHHLVHGGADVAQGRRGEHRQMLDLKQLQRAPEFTEALAGAVDAVPGQPPVLHISRQPRHDLLFEQDLKARLVHVIDRQTDAVGAHVDQRVFHRYSSPK